MRYLTDGELNVASRFLFLSMANVIIEQDIKFIEDGPFKIKEPYFFLVNMMIYEALNERKQLKKEIKNKRIQVVSLDKNSTFSSYLFAKVE